MKKILVPTDFSPSSKAGLRFAIQLAYQYNVQLIFFNSIELLIPTRWSDVKAKIRMDEEIVRQTAYLKKFVLQTYADCKRRPGKYNCIVRYGSPVSQAALEYAQEVNASYICMGTHGAGKLKKVMGTHTAAVIKKSDIPVFAIPKRYQSSKIRNILYASDFTDLKKELKTVKGLANKIGSSVSLVHYDSFVDPKLTRKNFDGMVSKPGLSEVKCYLEKFNWEETIGWHLNKSARKLKSDIVALFSERDRPWYQRILGGSNAVSASFETSKPLLVYPR